MEPTHEDPEKNDSANKSSNFWIELVKLLVVAAVIVVPFRLFIAQPFIVDGASMDPTFKTGQDLVVDELTYHFTTPARGSVLIFKYPLDESKYFIKRVIGLPGETVVLSNGDVTIKNTEHPDGIALNEPYIKFPKDDTRTFVIPAGQYFVMGDNRLESADSRIWGTVPTKDIIGRPIIRVWPTSIWPGDKTAADTL